MGKLLSGETSGDNTKAMSQADMRVDTSRDEQPMDLSWSEKDQEDPSGICQEPLWQLKECLAGVSSYQPKMANLLNVETKDKSKVSVVQRNQSVYNLRCLTAFYGFSPEVFSLAVSILDRFVTKVKVQPKYLSCIATTCFYLAVRALEGDEHTPPMEKLIRVSQCDCRSGDILRMENIIREKLRPSTELGTITPLTILQAIQSAFSSLSQVDLTNHLDKMTSKLVMCLCHAELLQPSAATIALAVFAAELEELKLHMSQARAFLIIQNICGISDRDFMAYQEEVSTFLQNHYASPSLLPKLQLKWTISTRTMARLRPGYYGDTDLPAIQESPYDCSEYEVSSEENLHDLDMPGTPTHDDFSHHFSYPNSPIEGSPLTSGLPPCPLITYADVVSGRIYSE